jgi:hypothetical protein
MGSSSSGSESDDNFGLEMWYVSPTPMHQHDAIILESSLSSSLSKEEPNHVERVYHDHYF